MTIKELSEFTGKTERAVRNWVNKAAELSISLKEKSSVSSPMNPSDYNIDEIELILDESSMGRDAVRILMENARKPIATLEVQSTPNQIDVLLAFMAEQQQVNQKFMAAVMSELKGFKQQPLQIEQPKQDYYSLVAYCSLHKIKTVSSELRKMGMDLRKMSKESGKQLHKVPDERWGEVNSYHIEVLNEYFSE